MLPKKHRISRELFIKLRNPRRINSALFSVSLYSLPSHEATKAACIISRKISGKAVIRNVLRRRYYSALRTIVKNSKLPRAIVIYPKQASISVSYEDLKRELDRLLEK